jgi:hypothetical protein
LDYSQLAGPFSNPDFITHSENAITGAENSEVLPTGLVAVAVT